MANTFVTPSIIAKEVLAHLENEMVIANHVSTDYSKEYTAVGDTVNVRRPVRFIGQEDNLDVSSYNEDIQEKTFPLQLNKTLTIKMEISPLDRTLKVEDSKIQERYIQPAVIKMKDTIEAALAAEGAAKFWNFTGSPGTAPATFKALGEGGTVMTNAAVPHSNRYAFHNPNTALELSDGLKNVFVQEKARAAYEDMQIGRYAGFMNYESVHVPAHQPGIATGTPLVNGANQNTTYDASGSLNQQNLVTDGWTNSTTGILKAGDVITIAGVFAVNPITKQSTGRLQNFVVKADADSGASTGPATISISPAIITSGAYRTVSAAPADNAAITVVSKKSGNSDPFSQSLQMHRNALTLVTRPLLIPENGLDTSTIQGNKVSLSVTRRTDFNTLKEEVRLDMLYRAFAVYPDLGARLAGA